MKEAITMVIGGNLLCLSCGGGGIPEELEYDLASRYRYTHLYDLRGAAAYDAITGDKKFIGSEIRLLYRIDSIGRFCTPVAFRDKLTRELTALGYPVDVRYVKEWSSFDPDRFKVCWRRIDTSKLKYRQEELLKIAASIDHGTFVAPPGFGKSYLFKEIVKLFPKARIHIVVDSINIQTQIYNEMKKEIYDVGLVNGAKKEFKRVTLISAQSLKHADPHDKKSPRGADILIGEEAHKLLAPTYSEALSRYKFCKTFAFTATPSGRFDGGDLKIESLFGPTVFEMPFSEAAENELVVPITVEWLQIDGASPCAGMRGVRKERWGLWRNDTRNAAIAARVGQLPEDSQVLILVSKTDHAMQLKRFLPDFRICYDRIKPERYEYYIKHGMIDRFEEPPMDSRRREILRTQFKERKVLRVIATDVWSTGVSFESLDVLIRADGRSSPIMDYQAPGRVSRRSDGKARGLVIDCMDVFDKSFHRRSLARKRQYAKHGWEQLFEPTPRRRRHRLD